MSYWGSWIENWYKIASNQSWMWYSLFHILGMLKGGFRRVRRRLAMTDGVKDVTIIVWYYSVAFLNYHYSYPILANHENPRKRNPEHFGDVTVQEPPQSNPNCHQNPQWSHPGYITLRLFKLLSILFHWIISLVFFSIQYSFL